MDPFRDELAAARARIAELEATLEKMRPVRKASVIRFAALVGSFLSILFGLSSFPIEPAPVIYTSHTIGPSRTWRDHLTYAWNDEYTPLQVRTHIDCFSGEYECR